MARIGRILVNLAFAAGVLVLGAWIWVDSLGDDREVEE
jgi:hypothetical protein